MDLDSLQLPRDQIWDFVSHQPTNDDADELLFFEDCLIPKDLDALELEDSLSSGILETSAELLEFDPEWIMDGDDVDINEVNVSDDQWMDQPIMMPEEHPALAVIARMNAIKECSTPFFKRWDPVEMITPPQTPPEMSIDRVKNDFGTPDDVLENSTASLYLQHTNPKIELSVDETPLLSVYQQAINLVQAPLAPELQRELEVVDELIRSRSQNLPDCANDDNSSESGFSNSSYSMASPSVGSDLSYASNDDDWSPQSTASGDSAQQSKSSDLVAKKKRSYRRSPADRTHRKKEQNKNAANRYRLKKKAEIEILLEEERELTKVNEDLQVKFSDVKREIKYLKGLMRELYQSKGLLD